MNQMKFQNVFILFLSATFLQTIVSKPTYLDDICSRVNNRRIYLDNGESGALVAKYNIVDRHQQNRNLSQNRCSIELVTCPWCVIHINFSLLNISRNCGNSKIFDSCGCDYVWIYEPSFESISGEQFCGHFIANNISSLYYHSQTRRVAITFLYHNNYNHAFSLDYYSQRNRQILIGYPKSSNINNSSQIISSPFFSNYYPKDLNMEYVIKCDSLEKCRVSLVFTDFLIHDSSIIEIFDWNGQRLLITTGNIFRPPAVISSGPQLVVRFYANGVTNLGFKAYYSFTLGDLNETVFKPDLDCGGPVHNVGGGITMMQMVEEGSKFYDCVWLIRPSAMYFHMKTHLYVKIIKFTNFAGSFEIIIRQGLTSNGPIVESIKLPPAHFYITKPKEHVIPISQGFYVSLRGLFRPASQLIIVYAAFSYKDCYTGSDFLCQNLRCISTLLNCDGVDHCGDNSDESPDVCSKDSKDRRNWSKIPNFLFPKVQSYSDLTAATLIFLLCTFGLIGLILALALLLYRINVRSRHQSQIHIETIHAMLEEGAVGVEEEIIIADDPPIYEPPPEYGDVVKMADIKNVNNKNKSKRCSRCHTRNHRNSIQQSVSLQGTSRSCQTTPALPIPDSPPPDYNYNRGLEFPGPSGIVEQQQRTPENQSLNNGSLQSKLNYKSKLFMKTARRVIGFNQNGLSRNFSDSELICSIKFGENDQISMNFSKSLSSDYLVVRDC